jgi:hypothetical protein
LSSVRYPHPTLFSSTRATHLIHLLLTDLITRAIFSEEDK